MSEDAEFLHRYASDHSEAAFTELIQRHVDLVYSAALRLANSDVHRAQDVTQQVFSELARQAKRLALHPALAGWLYTTTRRMALHSLRTEQRRTAREQEATTMNELIRETTPAPDWEQLRPVLEDAMHELREQDRLVVLLRFFQNQSLKDVGRVMGLNENAARMRVERALDKLRVQLARKGVTSTTAALALALTGNAVVAAPSAFVTTLASASLAGAAGTGTTLTLLKLMATTKLKLGILGAVVVVSVVTPLVIQRQSQLKLRVENESLRQQVDQLAQLTAENERLSDLVAKANNAQFLSNELLRVRGEVGLLRLQNADLAAKQGQASRNASTDVDTIAKSVAEPPPPDTAPFRAQVHTRIDFGQTLITGGWATAHGRRMFVFVRPELGQTENGARTITLTSTGIEIPESLLGSYGLQSLASDSKQTVQQGQLSASVEADAFLKQLATQPDTRQSSLGIITTFPGQPAQLQIAESDRGQTCIIATPDVAQDGKAFDLQLDAVLTPATQKNQAPGK